MFKKLSILVIAGLLVSVTSLFAQPKGGPGKGPDMNKMIEELTEKLSLTSDQAAKVKIIMGDMESEMKAMFGNGRPDRDKMDELRTETDEKIMKILTEEQQTKFKELQKERENKMRRGGKEGRPEGPRD